MAIFSALSAFALRQVAGDGAENVVKAIGDRFSDRGGQLTEALRRASERAWRTLEIALAGESFWNRLDAAEDKAFRQQVRGLLESMTLTRRTTKEESRRLCLAELRAARKDGLLLGGTREDVARSARLFAGQADQLAALERERAALREMAGVLQQAGYENLAL